MSGCGLLYINNVGTVVLALFNASPGAPVDPVEVAQVQATQVSVISVWNCLGRISMGARLQRLTWPGVALIQKWSGRHGLGLRENPLENRPCTYTRRDGGASTR